MGDNNIILKEVLNDCKEKYSKVRKLLDEDAKNDPASEPYFSKYKAKLILKEIRQTLETKVSRDVVIDAMLGVILLQIGIIDMDTEELSSCEEVLTEAETLLSQHSLHQNTIITLLNVYNHLGILWCNREVPDKAKSYLIKAKDLYVNFKCTLEMPISTEQLFGVVEENTIADLMSLEKAYTLTLYYLAQLYGTIKLKFKSAIYYHITLKRQLQYNDYDYIDWALNAATLSQFFAVENGFSQSRHHLAAASTILGRYEEQLRQSDTGDAEFQAKLETFNHRAADVALCWSKYCLNLMSSSKQRLLGDSDELAPAITDLSNLSLDAEEDICEGDIKKLVFHDLDLTAKENEVTDKYLLTFDDAREVFLTCQNWLNKAKEYYSLESLASDYIKIVQDHSQALSHLAFFEDDEERQAKMHKKRINLLEDLLKEINPTYYMQYCRQLWYELGEIYTDLLNLKMEKLNSSRERPTPHALKKINMLCDKSIENYEEFLKSLKDPKTGNLPPRLESDVIRPVVNAYVIIGRNTMKKIVLDKNLQLVNYTKSYESYKAAVDFCDQDENALEMMNEEVSLCREMLNILPIKIKMLSSK